MFQTGCLYLSNLNSKGKTVINQGGTSSGKTFSILQVLFSIAVSEAKQIITVVGQDMPNLKVGAIRDANDIVGNSEQLKSLLAKPFNKSDKIFEFKSGSIIEFKSYDNFQDAKSGKRDYLFCNEANGIPFPIYSELDLRTRKKTFLDYNPNAEFWVHEKLIGQPDVELIISDHRHNPFLSQAQREKIEGLKEKDYELWRVYARGLTGKIEGLIFRNWSLCEAIPIDAKYIGSGMDFGFTCFEGNTLVTTINGDIPIKDIVAGDMVLTRFGYKRVLKKFNNGVQEVIEKNIGFDFGLIKISCTFNHLFNVNDKWKQFGLLEKGDKLFTLSNLTERFTRDTQKESIKTTTFVNTKKTGLIITKDCIAKCINIITARLKKVWLSIMPILTLSTTIPIICLLLLFQHIERFTPKLILLIKAKLVHCIGKRLPTQKKIGSYAGKRFWIALKQKFANATIAPVNLPQQTHTSGFAIKSVIINGNIPTLLSILRCHVNGVMKSLWETSISSQKTVAVSALISHQTLIEKRLVEVYDIEVEDVHEYFANGILVHNCDPTAVADVYQQNGELWIHEQLYRTDLTNQDIFNNVSKIRSYVADSAEPKSIEELRRMGLKIEPAMKGADSILAGIDILKRYHMNITRDSVNLRKELANYKWKVDRLTGKSLNEPTDCFNHILDSVRYLALNKLKKSYEGRPRFNF